jgi:hypothetical protein
LAVVFVSLLLGKRCQHSLNQGKRLCSYIDTDQLPAMSFLLASDMPARPGPALRGTMEEVSLLSGCRRVLQDIGERGERGCVDERGDSHRRGDERCMGSGSRLSITRITSPSPAGKQKHPIDCYARSRLLVTRNRVALSNGKENSQPHSQSPAMLDAEC